MIKITKFQILNSKILLRILVSSFLFLVSFNAEAAHLYFKTSKINYHVGESFLVSLFIDTQGKQINTISATLDAPLDKVDLSSIRYGNSIVSLWVQTPKVDRSRGLVDFTGGIPGGFSGSQGPILTMTLKAKREGTGKFFFQNVKVLLNDGQGTEVKDIKLASLALNISPAPPKPAVEKPKVEEKPEEVLPPDTIPPEEFLPLISRHPKVADNKYFVSFSAVDKDTGIAHYEVRETPLFWPFVKVKWVSAESPYVLRGQWWSYEVTVRAYDQAGNFRESSAKKPFHPLVIGIAMIIVLIAAVLITRFSRKQNLKNRK